MTDTIAYRITLGNFSRSANFVLKTLVYGRKPPWLKHGWAAEASYGHAFDLIIPGRGSLSAYEHSHNQIDLFSHKRDNIALALYVAEQLAGKRGTVQPLTQADLDAEYAQEYEEANR